MPSRPCAAWAIGWRPDEGRRGRADDRSQSAASPGTGLTLGVTLLWLLGVGLSALVVRHELNEVFDSALEETAQRLLPLAVVEITNREQMTPQRIVALAAHEEYLTYLVRDARGNILLRSHD